MWSSDKDSSISLRIGFGTSDLNEQLTLAIGEVVSAHTTRVVITVHQASAEGWCISTLLQLACADDIAVVVNSDVRGIESLTGVCGTSSDCVDGA